jgi:hypothetical protein
MIFIHEAVDREEGGGFCAAVVLASTVLVW